MRKKRKNIGIYSPYLDILGGGERYILKIAQILKNEFEVTIFFDKSIAKEANRKLNIDLKGIQFLPIEVIQGQELIKKYRVLHSFDIFFYMTDGSVFFPLSKRNFLIIQSPSHIPINNVINKLKLNRFEVICYSKFMHKIILDRLSKESAVLPPAVDIKEFSYGRKTKKKMILTVGRFFSHLHSKKHEVIIEIFKKAYKKHFTDWSFVIVGGFADRSGYRLFKHLRKSSEGYPIEILANISFNRLIKFYKQAKIYWHATGFGENLIKFPERAEHFGITTIEAMAAGCVPMAYKGGGQKEIINEGINGYLWNRDVELIKKTKEVINNDKLFNKLSENAVNKARDYSEEKLHEKLTKLIQR